MSVRHFIVLIFLALASAQDIIPTDQSRWAAGGGNCSAASGLAYYGMLKLDSNGFAVADARDGQTCGNYCYYPSLQSCTIQSSLSDAQRYTICPGTGYSGCGGECCNHVTMRCETYSESNGFVQAHCVRNWMNPFGFWSTGLPIILTLLTILGVILCLVVVSSRFAEFGRGEMAIVALSVALIFFGVFYYFSSGWQYGVIIALSCCVGILCLGASYRPVRWFCVYVQVALFLAMLGWGQGNLLWGNWGAGILDSSTVTCNSFYYGDYFSRTSTTSFKWSSYQAAARAGADWSLQNMNWGYCDQNWWVALWVFGAIGICLSAMLLAGHTALLVNAATR